MVSRLREQQFTFHEIYYGIGNYLMFNDYIEDNQDIMNIVRRAIIRMNLNETQSSRISSGFNIIQNKTQNIAECDMVCYVTLLFKKLFKKLDSTEKYEIPNVIAYLTDETMYSSLIESFSSEKRECYINEGMDYGEKFFHNLYHETK
jgi:hypothetical protein